MEINTLNAPNENAPEQSGSEFINYRDNTYEIISKFAYLLGVRKSIYENENTTLDIKIYKRLELDKNARIIRNLCVCRTAILRYFGRINQAIKSEYRGIRTVGEYIPDESMKQLSLDGADFVKKSSICLTNHVVEINRLIKDRINNCKSLFPLWINWDYIRDLFIMPDGLNDTAVMAALDVYRKAYTYYPYQMYMNWEPVNQGNILSSDKKFLILLYQWHNDRFAAHNMVSNAGSYVKNNIYDFIDESESTVLVVDCENSDPFNLCAAFKNLDEKYLKKISNIILFDDIHASTAWELLGRYTGVPIEHLTVDRLNKGKSLVDQTLMARVFREHYQNNVSSFLLASSDSDYWAMISNLPEADFLVMVERTKCGPNLKQALDDRGIFYCYLDDFYGGSSEDIKLAALFAQLKSYAENAVRLNANAMLDEAIHNTRVIMSPDEKSRFYDKYIKNMSLVIDENGDVSIEFRRK